MINISESRKFIIIVITGRGFPVVCIISTSNQRVIVEVYFTISKHCSAVSDSGANNMKTLSLSMEAFSSGNMKHSSFAGDVTI